MPKILKKMIAKNDKKILKESIAKFCLFDSSHHVNVRFLPVMFLDVQLWFNILKKKDINYQKIQLVCDLIWCISLLLQ